MTSSFLEGCIACLQFRPTWDLEVNFKRIESLIQEAVFKGAQWIVTPEHTPYIFNQDPHIQTQIQTQNPIALDFFKNVCRKYEVWICTNMGAWDAIEEKCLNRSYLFNAQGYEVAVYDKIHLFNATLSAQESYRESSLYASGKQIITVPTPWGICGLATCYDLRFPMLFRVMRRSGAHFFCIPSAFAYTTGKDHWKTLLKARAIENGCYVIAPNQYGARMFGHSMIVSPWGEVLQEASDEETCLTASISYMEAERVRSIIPSSHFD